MQESPLAPEPFEELLGVQGVVAHVDALPDLAVSGADLLPSGVGVDDGDAPAVGVQRELAAALRRPSAGLRVDAPVGDEDVRVGVTSVLVGVDGVRAGVAVGRDVP